MRPRNAVNCARRRSLSRLRHPASRLRKARAIARSAGVQPCWTIAVAVHEPNRGIPMSARQPITTLVLCAALTMPLALLPLPAAQAQVSIGVGISVGFAPPPLPVYMQPALPAPGYIWTPGYWAYDGDGYYWVPGAWVLPPAIGMLWTPGYWAYYDNFYRWHPGYWGPRVGFYGGVNYGYGYGGIGFVGGRWDNGRFAYNRAVVNFGRKH